MCKLSENDIIYMVLTDRFYVDSKSAAAKASDDWKKDHPEYNPQMLKFYNGGTWKGIEQQLDYIKSLGVTAIWISPVSENEKFNTEGNNIISKKLGDLTYDGVQDKGEAWHVATWEAYDELLSNPDVETGCHGYFTKNFANANPHFGTKGDLIHLANEIKNKSMKLILDVVPNHTADYYNHDGSDGCQTKKQLRHRNLHADAPFDNPDLFHHNGMISKNDWDNFQTDIGQHNIEIRSLGGLSDIDQENAIAKDTLFTQYSDWVRSTSPAGLRVDAARCMNKKFLYEFERSMGVPTFGEIFEFDVPYVASFQENGHDESGMWGCLDFPLFLAIRQVFALDETFDFIDKVLSNDNAYANANRLVTFIDNHDRDRFLCVAKDNFQKLRLALAFLFTSRGIPTVYYGTEQGLYGSDHTSEAFGIANKYNREMMDPKFFDTHSKGERRENSDLFEYIQFLTYIRKKYDCLRNGTQVCILKYDTLYAYSRYIKETGEEIITIFNNGIEDKDVSIQLITGSNLELNTELVNLLDSKIKVRITEDANATKKIALRIPAKTVYIFIQADKVEKTYIPLKRTVTTIRVHHNLKNGHDIFLRGYPYPLFGEDSCKMLCVKPGIWEYQTERFAKNQEFKFKVIIDNTNWSPDCFTGMGGQTVSVTPTFYKK